MNITKKRRNFRSVKSLLALLVSGLCLCGNNETNNTPPYGYVFKKWGGPPIDVIHYFPTKINQNSAVLIVVPGDERDVQMSHSRWIETAKNRGVIVLTIGARKKYFPDDYSYSSGRVVSSEGHALHQNQWLFSAIEPLFVDFKIKFKLKQKKFYLVGENEGGGFVHRYLLFNPKGLVLGALVINPDFVTIPDKNISYPFGLKNSPISNKKVKDWLECPLTIVSTPEIQTFQLRSLSNSPIANIQGESRNKRGEFLFNFAKNYAAKKNLKINWSFKNLTKLESNMTIKKQSLFNLLLEK